MQSTHGEHFSKTHQGPNMAGIKGRANWHSPHLMVLSITNHDQSQWPDWAPLHELFSSIWVQTAILFTLVRYGHSSTSKLLSSLSVDRPHRNSYHALSNHGSSAGNLWWLVHRSVRKAVQFCVTEENTQIPHSDIYWNIHCMRTHLGEYVSDLQKHKHGSNKVTKWEEQTGKWNKRLTDIQW